MVNMTQTKEITVLGADTDDILKKISLANMIEELALNTSLGFFGYFGILVSC